MPKKSIITLSQYLQTPRMPARVGLAMPFCSLAVGNLIDAYHKINSCLLSDISDHIAIRKNVLSNAPRVYISYVILVPSFLAVDEQ